MPCYPDLPTGVGFCFYVRRALLDAIGPFDPAFGAGYGEENDFCMRAQSRRASATCCATTRSCCTPGASRSRGEGAARRTQLGAAAGAPPGVLRPRARLHPARPAPAAARGRAHRLRSPVRSAAGRPAHPARRRGHRDVRPLVDRRGRSPPAARRRVRARRSLARGRVPQRRQQGIAASSAAGRTSRTPRSCARWRPRSASASCTCTTCRATRTA